MPEIKCPGCSAGGRVPRDKMNTRLVCKKCLRVFHIGPTGTPVLGEPPAPKDVPKERAPRQLSGGELAGSFDELASKLSKLKLPKVSPQTLGIIAGVALVLGLGYWFFARQSLETRANRIATAIKTDPADVKTIMDLCSPGSEIDAITWYSEAVKRYGDLKNAMGGIEPRVSLNILSDGSSGPAVVVARFSSEGTRLQGMTLQETAQTNPSLANSSSALEIPLYLVKDFWGNWLLDAKRTAEGKP